MPSPSPKTLLRIFVNFCLVGWGASAIYQVSHVGPGYDRFGWIHQLSVLFFFGFIAFALFFAEYAVVQRLSKRELNPTFGYIQSFGCFLVFISGIWGIYYAHWRPLAPYDGAFLDNVLRAIYVFGHVVFLGNIIWSYMRERTAS